MKKQFRIILFNGTHSVAKEMAVSAALSNGHNEKLSLQDIESYFKTEKQKSPETNRGLICTIVDHVLFVDYSQKDKTPISILRIDEVELTELLGLEESVTKFIDEINKNDPDDLKDF